MIDHLSEFFSNINSDNDFHNKNTYQISNNPWTKFTTINLPISNSNIEHIAGVLIGITPKIHGNHRKSCSWVTQELHTQLQPYLPPNFDLFTFRSCFGIRGGQFKAYKDSKYPAYLIHCSNDSNIHLLTKAMTIYGNAYHKSPEIYNLNITIVKFSESKREATTINKTIEERLKRRMTELRDLIRVKLPTPLSHTIDHRICSKISSLKFMKTFCFILQNKKIYLMIHFVSNNHTAHYQVNAQIDKLEEMFSDHLTNSTTASYNTPINFPTRSERDDDINNNLISLFDNNNSNQAESYNKLTTKNADGNSFYAVTAGRSIGIFNDWSETQASISGYSHSSFVKLKTYEEAEQHMLLKRPSNKAPSNTYKPQSYSMAAQLHHHYNNPNLHHQPYHQHKKKPNYNNTATTTHSSSNSTSSITLDTIRSECPPPQLNVLEDLIKTGTDIHTLQQVVSGWNSLSSQPPHNSQS